MKTAQLLDSWGASGSDYEEFEQVIRDLANSTYAADVSTNDLVLLHANGLDAADRNRILFSVHSKSQIAENKLLATSLDTRSIRKNGMNDEFIDEVTTKSKLMMRMSGLGAQREDFYFTSTHLSRDLAARADIGGDAIYDPTNERDTYIMSRYVKSPKSAIALIRRNSDEGNAIHKIFALPSSTYCHLDQTLLLDIIEYLKSELGGFNCDCWSVDHFFTQIWLTFPEQADDVSKTYGLPDVFMPGVLLETSDTGDCSLRAVAFWERTHGSRARFGIYEREHRGYSDRKEIIDGVRTKFIPDYAELPQRLCELLTIDIDNPAAAIESVFRQSGLLKVLGKRRANNLMACMNDELRTRKTMTGYELARMFMDLPARVTGCNELLAGIETAVGKVPFLNFTKIAKATHAVTLV